MAWTTPKTWISEPLTSIDLNTFVRDNQNHLKDRIDNSASRIVSGPNSISTTSSEWVDVDPQELSLTLQTHGGDVLVGLVGAMRNSNGYKWTNFNISVDGTDYFADDGFTALETDYGENGMRFKPFCVVVLIPDLAAGNHTIGLRWKTQAGNTAIIDIVETHPQFWAKEI